MDKKYIFLIIGILVLSCCDHKKNNSKLEELSESKVSDSINSILVSISDDWKFVESKITSNHKIALPEIDEINIQYWTKINSREPINELSITGLNFKYVDSANTMVGSDYDYKAKVEYRNKTFGLNITTDSISEYIGISDLTETYFLLANGQHFARKK